MIHVVAEIVAKSGQREAVLQAFKANVPAVHAEEGCIEYATFVDAVGFGSLAPYGDDACAPRRRALPMEVDSIRIIVDWSGS